MPGPLAGIRVLELARILAGPWAGQILADLGADVVKVERTGAGDDTRGWGPPFVEGADGSQLAAAYYHSCNRGKRSVAVDFETEDGRRIVHKLASALRRGDRELQDRRARQVRARLRGPRRRTTRASSIARSPASGRTAPTRIAPATTC